MIVKINLNKVWHSVTLYISIYALLFTLAILKLAIAQKMLSVDEVWAIFKMSGLNAFSIWGLGLLLNNGFIFIQSKIKGIKNEIQ